MKMISLHGKNEGTDVNPGNGSDDGKTTIYIYNGQEILFEETFDTDKQSDLDNSDEFLTRELNVSFNGNIAKITMEYSGSTWGDGEVEYHLLDHLGSRQVVCSEDNGVVIAGCQIHYAVKCKQKPNNKNVTDFSYGDGKSHEYERPTEIYLAE